MKIYQINNLSDFHILVTGACGFIGRELIKKLLEKNARVTAIDKKKEFPCCLNRKYISKFIFLSGELKDTLKKITKSSTYNSKLYKVIVHLAASADSTDCIKNPKQAFKLNVSLTSDILEFCRKSDIHKLIFPSTGLVYGDTNTKSVREEGKVYAHNIYTATKLASENLIQGYANSYDLKAIVFRLGNVYGKNGNKDTVIQTVLKQIQNGNNIKIMDGTPIRDFIYINDVINAIIAMIVKKMENNYELYNVSTGVGISIYDLVKTTCKIAGFSSVKIKTINNYKNKNSSLILDNKKLKRTTGWHPNYSLAKGLSTMIKGK